MTLPPKYLFLDTEFTSFANSELLSLALVSLNGEELYLELDIRASQDPKIGGRLALANEFVVSKVLPQFGKLPQSICAPQDFGHRLAEWLDQLSAGLPQDYYICYDWSTDYALFEQCLREAGHWARLGPRLWPGNLGILIDDPNATQARHAAFALLKQRGLGPHHALADAWALAKAYESQG